METLWLIGNDLVNFSNRGKDIHVKKYARVNFSMLWNCTHAHTHTKIKIRCKDDLMMFWRRINRKIDSLTKTKGIVLTTVAEGHWVHYFIPFKRNSVAVEAVSDTILSWHLDANWKAIYGIDRLYRPLHGLMFYSLKGKYCPCWNCIIYLVLWLQYKPYIIDRLYRPLYSSQCFTLSKGSTVPAETVSYIWSCGCNISHIWYRQAIYTVDHCIV
jgi:hypothetical protein